MSDDSQKAGISAARGAVKAVAIGVGALGSLICLMSVVGLVIADGWVRVGVSLVVMVAIPALLADRLLPDDDPARAKGLPGDVFALSWLGFTVVFSILLGGMTRGALTKEGDRLTASGMQLLGRAAYLMAGVDTKATDGAAPVGSASASASTGELGVAPVASGVPEPAAADAGPVKKPANPDDLSPAELFKKLAPAVVTIAIKATGGMEGGGTGFLIDREGTIVTNQHVISRADSLLIRFMGGSTFEEVEVLVEDAGQDLALLRVKLSKPTEGDPVTVEHVVLGNSDKVVVGERAIAIGNPLGLDHTLTDGIVSARRIYEGRQWIQMSVPISPGNSGGPLFDMHGTVIGITTAGFSSILAQNLNLAVPVNALKQLVKSEYPGRRKIGKGSKSSTW